LVVGACLAETGNDVICADVEDGKISALKKNRMPIFEPGLEPLVVSNQEAGRLSFTTDVGAALEASEVIFIAVGTPPDEDGSADLQHVLDVARTIGDHMNAPKIVVTKSTVPVGTARKVRRVIAERTSETFHVSSNPEFLKEGAAVDDFMRPNRVIIGTDSEEARETLAELYAPFIRTGNPIVFMDIASAELTKYAANAMLATRISFMNQIAALCERVGADVTLVRQGIGSDERIGPAFLFPGPGYGGSCFPKDVKAIIRTAKEHDVEFEILRAVDAVNDRQKKVLGRKLIDLFDGSLSGRRIAVWGLAFKARTDDMRESAAIDLIEMLLDGGATVKAHDPEALDSARHLFGDRIEYAERVYDAVGGADALAILTEWLEYRNPDFKRIRSLMKTPIVVDGRNLYDPSRMASQGFTYHSIGRGAV
jgi:UDPglucose 6-dehydrogenase